MSTMENMKKSASDVIQNGKKKIESAQDTVEEYSEEMRSKTGEAVSHAKGALQQTPFLFNPSTWIALAFGSMVISFLAEMKADKKEPGNFIGLWAPCFMLMGIFSKIGVEKKD